MTSIILCVVTIQTVFFAHITVHFSLKWQFYTYPDTRSIIQERFYSGTIQYDAMQCLFKLGIHFHSQIRISQT